MVLITSAVKDVLGWSVRTCSVLRKVKPKVMFKGKQTQADSWMDGSRMTASGTDNFVKETRKQLVVEKKQRLDRLAYKSLFPEYTASNIENTLCLASNIYVSGDFNLDLMKEPHYNLYNDLVLSGLDHLISEVTRPESKSCLNQVYVNNPLRQQQM